MSKMATKQSRKSAARKRRQRVQVLARKAAFNEWQRTTPEGRAHKATQEAMVMRAIIEGVLRP